VGLETSFDPAFGLWAVGEGNFDAQFLHCPRELAHGLGISQLLLDCLLSVDLVDGIAINVEGYWATAIKQIPPSCGKQRKGVLGRDKFGMQDSAGRIIYVIQQYTTLRPILEPFVI
jgi:hypothetical protein